MGSLSALGRSEAKAGSRASWPACRCFFCGEDGCDGALASVDAVDGFPCLWWCCSAWRCGDLGDCGGSRELAETAEPADVADESELPELVDELVRSVSVALVDSRPRDWRWRILGSAADVAILSMAATSDPNSPPEPLALAGAALVALFSCCCL